MDIPLNNEEFIKYKRVIYLEVYCSQACAYSSWSWLCEAGKAYSLWSWQCSQELDLMIVRVFSSIHDSVIPTCHALLALGSARFGSARISPEVLQRHIWADDVWDPRSPGPCPEVAQGTPPWSRARTEISAHILGAQGFKHLSSSFLRCHNLGSTCGLRHSKWCLFKASWKQRAVEGVPAHSWSSTPNHSRILWYSSMKIKGIYRSLKVQIVLTSSFIWSNGRNVSKSHNYVHRDEFVYQVQADAVEIGQCCYL